MNELALHNSQSEKYKNPFGAVLSGSEIDLSIALLSNNNIQDICVHIIAYENREEVLYMNYSHSECEYDFYTAKLKYAGYTGLLFYYFRFIKDGKMYYYGNNREVLGGVGSLYYEIPPAFQITVYSIKDRVPQWFLDSVVYQIFPDRFYRQHSCGESSTKKNSFLYANWNDEPMYIKDTEGKIERWEFFGGNIKGIISKLDYLSELGIGAIYLNPIFESPSNHRYDTSDYKKIDSMLGDEADFIELASSAKNMGIHLILDGVFSHTGSDSIYFNRYGKYEELGAYQSKESKYYSWYSFEKYPDKYSSWWGIENLPNVNEMDESYLRYIIDDEDSVISHWIKKGAMGWRLDVADELPDEFIKRLKKRIRETNRDSVLIGEVWEDASNKISYEKRRKYLLGDELDSTMNYPFRSISIEYTLNIINAKTAYSRLMSLYENYPREYFYSCLNLIGTHDVPRILSVLLEKYDLISAKRAQKLIVAFQMTFPGVPCVYYGDEAGLQGGSDPKNRKTYPWGMEDIDTLNWYKNMIKLRNENEVFKKGSLKLFYLNDNILGFFRLYNDSFAICVFNNSNSLQNIGLDIGEYYRKDKLIDIISKIEAFVDNGYLIYDIEPLCGAIFIENL